MLDIGTVPVVDSGDRNRDVVFTSVVKYGEVPTSRSEPHPRTCCCHLRGARWCSGLRPRRICPHLRGKGSSRGRLG
jgi:hypothetical protein